MLETCRHLEKDGFKVTYVPVTPEGVIKVDELAAAITNETILITTMHVNNEIGTIQPIAEIGKIAKEKGVKFHTDAVQAMGKVKVDVNDLGVDLLSLSGHKIHGPKGIGVLYVRKGTPVRSLVYGGGHERGIRSGTENVPGIVGMGKACEIMTRDFDRNVAHMTRLRDRLMDGLMKIEHSRLNGPRGALRSPNNVNISYSFIEGESMVLLLDMQGIEVSTGSACSSKSLEPSHVLLSCGLPAEEAHGSLRMTNSKYTTEEDDRSRDQYPPGHRGEASGDVTTIQETSIMYSPKVMQNFANPQNVGEIPDADGVGTVGNPVCGDLMTIYIKVKDDKIDDIKFKTFGCGAAIATSSMITQMARGKTIDEALKITRNDVANELEGLPPQKMHCSNLAADALKAAIDDYRKKADSGSPAEKK